ncbi:hypothetical protein [Methylorubrum suomiense]|uniref:Uncharacterized protein n=1 Tax=Methylorubrum suomiense TaxID=144191 RepID=A0ABQ4UTV4_9HYPH|nr:hypothetical protein [Methylorubrum suomiense]GJE75544.1 hypothetical protein BGCPKDLD_2128 [Methylorubrum suomiense]
MGPEANAALKWLADQMCRVEEPLVGGFSNSLSKDGVRRLLTVMDGFTEHPTNDTLQKLGAFDRKTKVDKHTATHWGYLRGVIDALDAAGHSDAADVLIWQVWHRVNSAARHDEFYRLVLKDKAAVEAENARLMRLLTDGPANPQECAEFCKSAREDGDGKPCLDCDRERFTL